MKKSACQLPLIDRFRFDSLSKIEEQTLELHLSECSRCQQQFEQHLSTVSIESEQSDWLSQDGRLAPDFTVANTDSGRGHPSKGIWDREAILELSKRLLPPSDNPAMIGKLGEFEILEPLGAGGMGIVYKGYDHELNRFVAVKMLSPSLSASGAAKQRFLREAQAAAAVVHPNVVPIHAVSSEGQIPYLVMSYIPGTNLQEHLDEHGALAASDALRIGHQVALGLSVAHQHGVIHRDVKPANILLERNVHRALLTDFGLARAADDASLTHSGLLAGTPNYMSPEQARGEAIDARSDLFGLGCILYAMLAGHPPFRGEHAYVVLRRLIEEEPRSLTQIQPKIPKWLDRFVLRMLAKDPKDRFQSADEVAVLLQACHLHLEQPEQHPLPSILKRDELAESRTMNKRIVIGSSLMLIAICLGFSFGPSFMTSHDSNTVPIGDSTQSVSQSLNQESDLIATWEREEQESTSELTMIRNAIEQLENESTDF